MLHRATSTAFFALESYSFPFPIPKVKAGGLQPHEAMVVENAPLNI